MKKGDQDSRNGFQFANQYLPWIFASGLALGIANYSLGVWPTLGQSIFQHVAISFVIGYGILLVIWFVESIDLNPTLQYLVLALLFSLFAVIGSEVEGFINNSIFENGEYALFENRNIYTFNIILSNILGFGIRYWNSNKQPAEVEHLPAEEPLPTITELPIKQGDTVSMYPLSEAMFFESYDNYSFLHNLSGERILTNNSLSELERKLGSEFLRVHRKYLINRNLIHQVKPQFKSRYTIYFKDKGKSSIISGASFAEVIRGIIKI